MLGGENNQISEKVILNLSLKTFFYPPHMLTPLEDFGRYHTFRFSFFFQEKDETIVALKAQIAEMESKYEFFKQSRTPEHHSKAIALLQSELTEAKETLTMQKEHIEDLEETMSHATEAIEEKDEEIDKLKEVMSDESRYNDQVCY